MDGNWVEYNTGRIKVTKVKVDKSELALAEDKHRVTMGEGVDQVLRFVDILQ